MRSTWRSKSALVIARVLDETRRQTEKEIRAALRQAYPFERRTGWAYRVWLDEIRRQRGKKKPKLQHNRTGPYGAALEGQFKLEFGEE